MKRTMLTWATICGLSFVPAQASTLAEQLEDSGFDPYTAALLSECMSGAQQKYQVTLGQAGMICVDMLQAIKAGV